MSLTISDSVRQKLDEKHGVEEDEINECFSNVEREFLIDNREDHKSDPPTHWFVAETNRGRKLKVCFMHHFETNETHIKSAFNATEVEERLYVRHAKEI